MDGLYEDPELYDLVAPPNANMERFYVEAAGGLGRRVLELACGTGRITIPLAISGAMVTGVDQSEVMLAQAHEAAIKRGVSVDFVRSDMRNLALGQQFNAVLIAANSLLHLHTHDDFVRAFTAIRQHLAPGGRFVFDIFVPSARLLSLPAGQRKLLGTFTHARLGQVTIEETIAYNPLSQVSCVDWYWSTSSDKDFRRTPLDLRQIYPQELPLLLSLGGLKLDQRFGDFGGSPMTPESQRQVCIAVAA